MLFLSTLLLSTLSSLPPIMRATFRVAFLLACCVWAIIDQTQSSNQGNSSHSNPGEITGKNQTGKTEPIRFSNKAKDNCSMVILNKGNVTKLRVSCKNKGKSYSCTYQGKPNLCRAYSKNPRHYFTQIMWEMRKLQNSCQGFCTYKPLMCRSATDEAQMVFHQSGPTLTPSKAPTKKYSSLVTNPAETTTQSLTEIPKSWAARALVGDFTGLLVLHHRLVPVKKSFHMPIHCSLGDFWIKFVCSMQ
ncbi:hypothetical protein AMELA_G00274830 [Ameiurus melas]|uniref:Uncharacterized protein n=1 Tax=Ameiurus melas TaxID=219545 RepID=A0A7J5ZM82_AMEME|nr:hypothetical protein AMELA_G00274830 [Ameiurus melas]